MGVVHTFDPPRVILGGGLMSDDGIIQLIRKALPDHILDSYSSVEIVGAETGNRAGLLGAAALAMEAVDRA
ncbi:MAG: ROK family protein, partial [Clostridia bacterium]|nr:ROK family protein [Clostridia bacterium]